MGPFSFRTQIRNFVQFLTKIFGPRLEPPHRVPEIVLRDHVVAPSRGGAARASQCAQHESDQKVKVLWERRSHRPRADRKAPSVRASLKEAASRIHGPTHRNRLRGDAPQGERAGNREALAIKGTRRRAGGRVVKVTTLTWGDLASRLKGRHREVEREVSRGRSSDRRGRQRARSLWEPEVLGGAKDRTEGRANRQ